MMWYLVFGFLFAPIFSIYVQNFKNFGAYDPIWKNYELCKGPKFKNASETDLEVFQQGNDFYGTFKFNFLTRSLVDEIRLWLYSENGETKKQLWTYKISDPCKNFVFAELIQQQLNTDNCIVEKASYNKTINFTDTTRKLIGASFFYGNYSMKVTMASKNANILCLVLYIELLNKNKLNN